MLALPHLVSLQYQPAQLYINCLIITEKRSTSVFCHWSQNYLGNTYACFLKLFFPKKQDLEWKLALMRNHI